MRRPLATNLLGMAIAAAFLAAPPSQAQRSDPNLGHFYMARQQMTITDDSPVIINKQGGGGGGAGSGALQGGPAPLPRAGWVPYSQSQPGLSTSLPKTNNGVPVATPPPKASGMKSKARGLKVPAGGAKATAAAKPPSNTLSSYAPYKSYPAPQSYNGSSPSSTSSAVKGRMLKWRPGAM